MLANETTIHLSTRDQTDQKHEKPEKGHVNCTCCNVSIYKNFNIPNYVFFPNMPNITMILKHSTLKSLSVVHSIFWSTCTFK